MAILQLYHPIILQSNFCSHLNIAFGLCTICGKRMELDPRFALNKVVFQKLSQEKKLTLVLDLDHTLLHSIGFDRWASGITQEEKALIINQLCQKNPSFNESTLLRTVILGEVFATKLRPGIRHFLEEASKMFTLHVFTKGCFAYALEMMKLIDPERVYFDRTVFTQESSNNLNDPKSLDLVVGEPRGILIVDDTEMVWREQDRQNLIVIPKYNFFGDYGSGGVGRSHLALGTDESETQGHLHSVLRSLKRIHHMFFDVARDENLMHRDVRVLKFDLDDWIERKFL